MSAVVLGTALKLLLWPAYHSTDMEVHRNWLAITYSLPLRDWYYEATSPWTLDYPPFFAYLSWALAQPAAWIDRRIVDVHGGLDYAAWPCKAYMRATVMATEAVLGAALLLLARAAPDAPAHHTLLYSVFLHPGLLIVDHIHFQYNGFLFGVLLLAVWAARTERPLLCALLFSSLLQFKHLFVYIAPAFFVYLLRGYLFPTLPTTPSRVSAAVDRTLKLGAATLLPFAAALVPLVVDTAAAGRPVGAMLAQLKARLFPFDRGLLHAYWAPNTWALYAAADRVLLRVRGLQLPATSRGIVGDTAFGVLPAVPPATSFALALACILVYVEPLWRRPTYTNLVGCMTLCAMTSFGVGWHVHEKAILMVVVPMSLTAHRSYAHWRVFQLLSAISIVSLLPLLFTPQETPIKLLYGVLWYAVVSRAVNRQVLRPMPTNRGEILHWAETQYLRGLAVVALATELGLPLLQAVAPQLWPSRLAFLPLMLVSVYCALGFMYVWLRYSVLYLADNGSDQL